MNPGREQCFVGINVSYARYEFLTEQDSLDNASMFFEAFVESSKVDNQRIGSLLIVDSGSKVLESTELAHVIEQERSTWQFEERACVLARIGVP
jgi:hypothetical protein